MNALEVDIEEVDDQEVSECPTNNICSLCGAEELAVHRKCDHCDARIFCLGCDDLYHKHPKRQQNIRDEKTTLSRHNSEILKTSDNRIKQTIRHAKGSSVEINAEKHHLKYKTATVAKSQTLSSGIKSSGKQMTKFTVNSGKEKCQSKGKSRKLVKPQTVTSKDLLTSNDEAVQIHNKACMRSPPPLIVLKDYSSNHKEIERVPFRTDNDTDIQGNSRSGNRVKVHIPRRSIEQRKERDEYAPEPANIHFKSITLCFVCGSKGEVKCEECLSTILCVSCDVMYHLNPLRSQHKMREKLNSPDAGGNEIVEMLILFVFVTKDKHCSVSVKVNKPQKTFHQSDLEHQTEFIYTELETPPSKGKPLNTTQLSMVDVDVTEYVTSDQEEIEIVEYQQVDSSAFRRDHKDIAEIMSPTNTGNIKCQQKQQKQNEKYRGVRRQPTTSRMHSSNNQTLRILKAIKQNQTKLLDSLTTVRKQQNQLRKDVVRNYEEIKNLKESLSRKPKEKLVLDKNFVSPTFLIGSVLSSRLLDSACLSQAYSNQIAIRHSKHCASSEDTVSSATRDVMKTFFPYELLKLYSWTGSSALNVNAAAPKKEKFSELIGIQNLIKTTVTQNLSSSFKTDSDCIAAIKDNVRRASQNQSRETSKQKNY